MTSPPLSMQRCEQCGAEMSELNPATGCPACGGLLELIHPERNDGVALRATFAARRSAMTGIDRSGVWRYRELVLPSARTEDIVTHPEGNTPLLARERISAFARLEP